MSKAERRRKARARAREREQSSTPADALEQAVAAVEPAEVIEPEPAAAEPQAPESEFITGPVQPARRAPRPVPAPAAPTTTARRAVEPVDEDEEDEDVDDEDLDIDDDTEDGDDGEDEEADQEEALFNLACAALEEGERLSWQETIAILLSEDVHDPRLMLLIALLAEGAPEDEDAPKHVPLQITGARVLAALEQLELDELVAEAREVSKLAPGDVDDSPEDRAVVRTNARELNERSKRELEAGRNGERGQKAAGRPLRASDVRAARSSLGAGVTKGRQG